MGSLRNKVKLSGSIAEKTKQEIKLS